MELNTIIKDNIKKHALECSPNECCGLITHSDGNIISVPCQNISKTPDKAFIINPSEVKKYNFNNVIGFYHSHFKNSEFTLADIAMSEKINKFCILYVIEKDEIKTYEPIGVEIPYINRPFYIGILDCFTLFKDYYRRELNINLPDVVHEERFNIDSWKAKEIEKKYKNNLDTAFSNYFKNNNFIQVDNLRKYDVILFKMPKIIFPCHVAIYLENNQILHHLYELSAIESYSNALKRGTVSMWRHRTLL